MDILSKIKKANLIGRGGAGFPVADKWLAVKNAAGDKKYIVCNAAEGEPGVMKDGHILEYYSEKVIDGIKIAIDFFKAEKAYLYLNHDYYKKFNKKLAVLIKNSKIEIFIKPIGSGYIGGEESAVLNAIEGKRIEPRLKPPFPVTNGLWGYPTLINNVETFYNISLVASGEFKNERFYTISGDCPNEGVHKLAADLTVEKILKQTMNYPRFDFFVQIGGNFSGEVFNSKQLDRPVTGAGSITVYSKQKNSFEKMIKIWLDFYINESCGKCAPCREGIYRLREIFVQEKIDWQAFYDLLEDLRETSLCALGVSATMPIKSLINNVYPNESKKNKN